jgi:GT2 family glycosyltransferase
MSRFGFVILSFNHLGHTSECLHSVLNLCSTARIYLVHNGSDKKQILQLKNQFSLPQVQHFILEQNQGYSGGANYGLKMAFLMEDWVLFLTNDTLLDQLPSHLPRNKGLYAPLIFMKRNRKVDSLGGGLTLSNGHLYHIKDDPTFQKLKPKDKNQRRNTFSFHNDLLYVPGTAFLIDKETFEKVGGFDARLGTYWEDVDFSLKLQQKGLILETFPELKVLHKVGKTCHKDTYYSTYLFQRNRLIISWKYASLFEKLSLIASIISEIPKRFFRDFKYKKLSLFLLYLKALFQAFKMIVTNK